MEYLIIRSSMENYLFGILFVSVVVFTIFFIIAIDEVFFK
tara:strand:+ start:2067 stop:2186 length:120 start_codon:yes stop_codon:yes gene_type:complete